MADENKVVEDNENESDDAQQTLDEMTVLQDVDRADMSAEVQQVAPVEISQGEDAYGMATADMAFGSQYIGSITHVEGTVYIFRGDRTIEAEDGTKLMEGDTVKTVDGVVNLEFTDESQFSMGENGRIVLDEMVYDPAEQTGSLSFSLTDGAFGFVSGMIAKTDPDAMTLDTPVATIGIRGTEGLIDLTDGFKVVLLEEDGGFVGEIVVMANDKVFVLNEQNQFTTVIDNELQEPVVLSDDQIVDEFGEIVDIQDEASVLDEEIPELDNEESINVQLDGEHEDSVEGSDAVVYDDADHGSLTVNPDGTYTYVPETGFVGEDSFIIKYINSEGVEVEEKITVYVDDWDGFNDFQTDAGGPDGFDEDFLDVTNDGLSSEDYEPTDPTPNNGDTGNDDNTTGDTSDDTGSNDTPTGDAGSEPSGDTNQGGSNDGDTNNGGSNTTDPDPTDPPATDPVVTITTETRTETITGTETFKSSTNTISVERENDLENNREQVDTTTTTTNVYETPTTTKTYDVEIVTITDADGNVLDVEENVVLSNEETTYETREEVLTNLETTYEEPQIVTTEQVTTETVVHDEVLASSSNTTSLTVTNDFDNNREQVDSTTTTTNEYSTDTTVTTTTTPVNTITYSDGTTETEYGDPVVSSETTTETREEVLTSNDVTYQEPVTTVEYVTTTEVVRGDEVLIDSVYSDDATTENDLDTNREVTTTERTYTDTYETEVVTTTTTTPVYTITYSNGATETEQGEPTVETSTDTETRENVHVDEIVTYEDASVSVEYQTNVETVTTEPVITTETREYTEREIDYDNDRERIDSFVETTTTTSTTTLTTTTTTPVYTVMYPDGSIETEYGTPVIDTATSTNVDTDVATEAVDTNYEYPEITVTEDVQTYVETDGPTTTTTYEDNTEVTQNDDGTETEVVNRDYTDTTTTTTTTVTTTTPTTTLTYSDGSTETVVGDPAITTDVQTETFVEYREEVLDEDTTPFAGDDTFTGMEDETLTFALEDMMGNDYDADGDTIELVDFTNPGNGQLLYNEEAQEFEFTPNENWNGEVSFDYTIEANGDQTTATTTLEIADDLTDPGEPNYEDPDDDDDDKGHGNDDDGDDDDNPGKGHGKGDDDDDHPGKGKGRDKDDDNDDSKMNNGWGNGDQDAPGNSGDNNNAENADAENMLFVFGLEQGGDIVDTWLESEGFSEDAPTNNQGQGWVMGEGKEPEEKPEEVLRWDDGGHGYQQTNPDDLDNNQNYDW